jgi:recombination protein RecT
MSEVLKILQGQEAHFNAVAEKLNIVRFKEECEFALQHIEKNTHLMGICKANPTSLENAIKNVASIGISLNPAHAHAYLVPRYINRQNHVCLDIGYRGLVHIVTSEGALEWVQADVVKEKDVFTEMGMGAPPEHKINRRAERGKIDLVYCVAKTMTGDYLTQVMDMEEIKKICERSESYKAYQNKKIKSSPWISDFTEMAKKTVIKRAAKTWPSAKRTRLQEAIHVLNEHEGINFKKEEIDQDILDLDPLKDTPTEGPDYVARSTIFRDKRLGDIPRPDLIEFIEETEKRIDAKTYNGSIPKVKEFLSKAIDYLENY